MVLMAAVSLIVGLRTVSSRRARDQEPLGYLPADTNVVAAIHVSKILQETAGREFMTRFRVGPIDITPAAIVQRTGFQLEEIGDIVVGLRIDEGIPRVTVVIQTCQPFDEARVRRVANDQQPIERNQKRLYLVRLEKPAVPIVLWCAGPSTLVMGLTFDDLNAVPLTPQPGMDHLPKAFQTFPTDDVTGHAHAWIIGDSEGWNKTFAWRSIEHWAGLKLDAWKDVQTLGLWLRFDQAVLLKAAFRCLGPASARPVEEQCRKLLGTSGSVEIEKDRWVTLQYPTTVERLIELAVAKK
jgi:hypothetical protein